MQRGAIQLLAAAGQLLGEVVSSFVAGGAGILMYRSVTAALSQRGAVVGRPFRGRRW
ncbi:MAG TPA: hypothetical protein VFH00_08765 [Candidatus Nitrosotalea sp.]|nr:hypothetical protein [Candidatus Nitrosotalea sp.]